MGHLSVDNDDEVESNRSVLKQRAEEPRIGADLGWHTPVDRARCCGMMVLS